jgi:hypothetical protein
MRLCLLERLKEAVGLKVWIYSPMGQTKFQHADEALQQGSEMVLEYYSAVLIILFLHRRLDALESLSGWFGRLV